MHRVVIGFDAGGANPGDVRSVVRQGCVGVGRFGGQQNWAVAVAVD